AHVPCAMQAMRLYPGMRVLNQDPWEMIITFILSANNNVGRIKTLVDKLSVELGERYTIDGVEVCSIPSPGQLASADEEALRRMGVGYRAPYLKKTAQMVMEGFPVNELSCMDYEKAHELLVSLPGVGDKVADCVQLFGCGHSCAFPVDVWVERLLKSWFHLENCGRKKMSLAARELLGENCGIMQQFLFHAARLGDIEL
ncbi:MAG: 8-oxoguanine DNA glycosylase, partial [Clostridia bacterium]|nr:8-oxoguanine DNA glycosylase [Clostridia bacterium]